jgi:hypothetical protein
LCGYRNLEEVLELQYERGEVCVGPLLRRRQDISTEKDGNKRCEPEKSIFMESVFELFIISALPNMEASMHDRAERNTPNNFCRGNVQSEKDSTS